MRRHLLTALCAVLMLIAASTEASARKQLVPRMYMFGLAASFADTIVHFTGIQQVENVWIESKNDFLLERDNYSTQLRTYLDHEEDMPHRTCIVFYSKKRDKLEKKYLKMMRLYTDVKDWQEHFDVRHIDEQHFQFKSAKLSDEFVQDNDEQ